MQNKSGKEPGTRAGPVMVAVEAGLLMFGGVAGGEVPFAPECWLLQLGPSPLLGLKENEVTPNLVYILYCTSDCRKNVEILMSFLVSRATCHLQTSQNKSPSTVVHNHRLR